MNGINTISSSNNSLSGHLNIISDCLSQLGEIMTVTRDSIRSYASQVVSSFSGGGQHQDFLLVDRVVIMIKKLVHHIREMMHDIAHGGNHTQSAQLVETMNNHISSLEQMQLQHSFFYNTFGWALQEPLAMMREVRDSYQIG